MAETDRIVLCCLADIAAFRRITSACTRLKLHAVRISGLEGSTKPRSGVVCLFVYDLECSEPRIGVNIVRQFQIHYPTRSVFLYYKHTSVAAELVSRLGQRLGVTARAQLPGSSDEVAQLTRFIRGLIMDEPELLLRRLTQVLLHQSPRDTIWRFTEALLVRFEAAEPGAPRVEQLAEHADLRPWRLRRACRSAPAPNPERLAEWLTFIYVLQLAQWECISVARAAHRTGLDERYMRGLRARLLPDFPSLRRPLIPHAVTRAITRLAEECGFIAREATDAVRRAVGRDGST